jgi:hypothetical protein
MQAITPESRLADEAQAVFKADLERVLAIRPRRGGEAGQPHILVLREVQPAIRSTTN